MDNMKLTHTQANRHTSGREREREKVKATHIQYMYMYITSNSSVLIFSANKTQKSLY